ncbi:hypothetical protein Tco_0848618 [Tanacetum coccineum]
MGHGALHRGDRPPRSAYGGGRQMTDYRNDFNAHRYHYQSYVPLRANNRRYDNQRQESNHLGIDALTKRPKEILATEFQLQLLPCPPMVGTPKKENLDRYCDYHGEKGIIPMIAVN